MVLYVYVQLFWANFDHADDRFSANKKLANKEQIDTIDTTNPGNGGGNCGVT